MRSLSHRSFSSKVNLKIGTLLDRWTNIKFRWSVLYSCVTSYLSIYLLTKEFCLKFSQIDHIFIQVKKHLGLILNLTSSRISCNLWSMTFDLSLCSNNNLNFFISFQNIISPLNNAVNAI